jgi:TolB-like protein/tetratricopeptide (TPR) repeat protein
MIAGVGSAESEGIVDLAATPDFDLGGARVRPARRQLRLGDGEVRELEPRVMQVLVALARAGGEIVSRDRLVDLCWGGRIVGDDAINRCILALRRIIRSSDPAPFEIETIARVGYALVLPAGADGTGAPLPAIPVRPPAPVKSVAVLPFANLTGDASRDFIGDGMAEELITALSRRSDLKVPARTSTFSYKGRALDVRTIASELGVTAVLEGSIRTNGERIRVTAQLIEAESGFHLWAQNYDRDMADLIAVQDELAASIAQVLQTRLGGGPARPTDPRAYALDLEARGMAARATPDGMLRAIELHQQAIAIDPGYARAQANLAGTITVATIYGVLPAERRAEARARAEEAIRLDPDYAATPAILAALDMAAGRWLAAEAGFRRAAELDPDDPVIIEALALHLLIGSGHLRRSLALVRRAVSLAPGSANQHLHCAVVASLCGEDEVRDAHLASATLLGIPEAREGVRLLRSTIARQAGRPDEAADQVSGFFHMLANLMGAGDIQVVGPVYSALAGRSDPGEASEAIGRFVQAADADDRLWRFPAAANLLLQWQVVLGRIDGAFDIADRLVASWRRSGHLAYTVLPSFWREEMRPFRRDRRFGELVAQLGLPAFWERHGPPDGYELKAGCLVESGTLPPS